MLRGILVRAPLNMAPVQHTALIAAATGTEEIEFSSTFDVLVRAGFNVHVGGVGGTHLRFSRGMHVNADNGIGTFKNHTYDVVVLPGGMPGAENLAKSVELEEILKNQKRNNKYIAAICAAPALVLQPKGFLLPVDEVKATCYPAPNFQKALGSAYVPHEAVVVSGKIITSVGPGTAIDFGLRIVEEIAGKAKADEIAQQLVHKRMTHLSA